MASITCSSTSEVYKTKNYNICRNFNQRMYGNSLCTIASNSGVEAIGAKENITSMSHTETCFKLKRSKALGSGGTSEPEPASELFKVSKSGELDNGVTLVKESPAASNDVSVEKQGSRAIKLWAQLLGKARARRREPAKPGSMKDMKLKKSDTSSANHVSFEAERALSSIGPESSIETCNSLLKLLEKSNEDKTFSFFEWMKRNGKLKGNNTAYNIVLRVLGRVEDWEKAEALLSEMTKNSECKVDFQVFNTLIYSCSKKKHVEWGTKWFLLMLEKEVQPNVATFGMLMSLYQKGGNVTEAEFTFQLMRKYKLHCPSAYSSMITIYTRLGLYGKSEMIMNIMKEDKVVPNLESWLVQINAYSQQGKLEEAESVLNLMEKAGISPNIIAYNTLITGYGKVGNMEGVSRVFQHLLSMGLQPDESTYRSMIEGFGRADYYQEALAYYRELKHSGSFPNSSNLYTMINLQARHGDDEGAVETLKDMIVVGCQCSSILSSLVQAYERSARLDRLPLILRSSFYEKILSDQTSCSILAMAYVRHDLVDEAIQVLEDKQWNDLVFEEHLYHLLICACKEAGRYHNAIKIFSQMPKSQSEPNLHITCSMIDIYTILGQFEDGEALYRKLKASNIAFDMIAYSVVVRMYVKSGSLKDACLVLDAMEKQKDIIPDTYLFRDMLRIYQQCNMLDKLADVYYKILKSGITWDESMYNCVINCCARALQVDELSRLFNEMLQQGCVANTITINVMLDVYGKAGLLKKARKVLWMAKKQGLADAISYNTIIAAYGRNGDLGKMKSTFRRMELAGIPVGLEAYNSMLDAYGKNDRIEEFRCVLQKMKESSFGLDHYTYNIMINIYGKKGWIEDVAVVLAELKERGLQPDLWSFNTLIKAYGTAGMIEKAVDVIKEMRENGIEPDKVTYVNLIGALQKNDSFLEAVKWSLWMKQLGMANSNC